MLGFTGDGEDQVEHLVTTEIYCVLLIHSAAAVIQFFSRYCLRFMVLAVTSFPERTAKMKTALACSEEDRQAFRNTHTHLVMLNKVRVAYLPPLLIEIRYSYLKAAEDTEAYMCNL